METEGALPLSETQMRAEERLSCDAYLLVRYELVELKRTISFC